MIYLDNAATSKPEKKVLDFVGKCLEEQFYNPSALYAEGYNLHRELERARENIVSKIADPGDYCIIMTSCGTEADNHALLCGARRGNLVTTMGEHAAVYAAAAESGRRGTEPRFASLNSDGSVNVSDLLSKVDGKTSLVSVIHVNNETGAVNDIDAISKAVKKINPRTLFHSDGVQAFGKISFRLDDNIDMYSISAHKIGGLKGCGALIKKKKLVLSPFIFGGGQEGGLRSGTENFCGVMTFSLASDIRYSACSMDINYEHVKKLHSMLWNLLDKDMFVRISPDSCSPYILTVAAKGVRGETVLHMCDDEGLIIGTGSACSSNSAKRYSRVMQACGLSSELIDGVLRLSFGIHNTEEEIKIAAGILNRVIKCGREAMK